MNGSGGEKNGRPAQLIKTTRAQLTTTPCAVNCDGSAQQVACTAGDRLLRSLEGAWGRWQRRTEVGSRETIDQMSADLRELRVRGQCFLVYPPVRVRGETMGSIILRTD
eukprot:COSAG01_NODE_5407_length_4281_cov_1.613196_2_plen_109_part_00